MKKRKSEGEPQRLLGYVRCSTEEQAQSGLGMEAQRERIAAYVTAQGAHLAGIEADEGVSGTVAPDKRLGLSRALERVRAGEADGLVVMKLDRLSRRVRDALDLFDACEREGWRLVVMDMALDSATPTGRFACTMLAAVAELERNMAAERTQAALDELARQGRGRSRYLPFGLRSTAHPEAVELVKGDRSLLVEYAPESRILDRMLRLRDREGLGARRVAAKLDEAQVRNPRTGRPFYPALVARILGSFDRRAQALG
jgi:DNA invertase Pin-like site-specific DNA recombinase